MTAAIRKFGCSVYLTLYNREHIVRGCKNLKNLETSNYRILTNLHGCGATRAASQLVDTLSKKDILQYFDGLTPQDKYSLIQELKVNHATETKTNYEKSLANMRWRSKLGRYSNSETDATGTYCEVPSGWVLKKKAEGLPPLTFGQLFSLARFHAMPFIGFGFLDNLVMIVAGDYIDLTIGATLGISTMAAAALGNAVSDVAGIGSAWYVESLAEKIGVTHPEVHPSQLESSSARWFSNIGRALGVLIGCIIGMFPLLFLPSHKKSEKRD